MPDGIGLMTEPISRLIESGHAYPAAGGSVYFDARSFPGYGELSGGVAPAQAGQRRAAADGQKRSAADWVLWRGAPAGQEPSWPAPWGNGPPGPHTACSALSLHYLGDTVDVHTGGAELLFPHHEDERAQSNSVTGHEVVRHWAHAEHLLFDGRPLAGSAGSAGTGGTAGSAGGVVLLSDLVGRGLDPLALRLALLEHHYRQQPNLSWDSLAAADRMLRKWRHRVAEWAGSPSKPMCAEVTGQIAAAFDEDLDTPAALRALSSLETDHEIPPGSKFETFAYTDQILGLDLARDVGRV